MSIMRAIPLHRNPALLPGVVAVMAWLLEQNYGQWHREAIGRYAHIHGELNGTVDAGWLDHEDLETAEAVFIEALPEVPGDDLAWTNPAVYLDADSLAEAWDKARSIPPTATLVPPELDDDAADAELAVIEPPDGWPDAPDYHWSRTRRPDPLRAAGIAPISGGAPAGPEPTAGDRRDFEDWLASVDRDYPPADQAVDRHSPEALARIHRALYGRAEPFHA